MTGKYQPYPQYTESGIPWSGRVPAHWIQVRFKHAFVEKAKRSNPELPAGSISFGRVVYKDEERLAEDTKSSYQEVLTYEFLINPLNLNFDLKSLRTALSDIIVVVSTGYIVLRSTEGLNKRFARWLLHEFDVAHMKTLGSGVRQTISFSDIGNSFFCKPPLEDQRAIATFLDYETARIDRLIAKQQRLIELLKEKRQAVISHAVTKGLNPDAPMKDSGVEWLGQVPAHWKVSRIKNYAKIESGHTPDKKKEEYWTDCDIPWVSLNDSKTLKVVDYIDDTAYKVSELGIANSSARLLPAQAVVFTRDASIGLSAITTKPMAVSQHLIAWLGKSHKLLPEFLLLVFYGMEKEFERYTFGATIKTIGMDDIRSLTASFPPLEEQKEIVGWAFQKIEKLQKGVSKAESVVSLLQERRTALISAAVTGKIDVRNRSPAGQPAQPELLMAAEQHAEYQVS
jgi:type I restriction enzyme S subunit